MVWGNSNPPLKGVGKYEIKSLLDLLLLETIAIYDLEDEEFDRYSKQCLAVEDSCSKFGKFVWEFESFGAWCDSRENLVDLFQQIQRIIWKTITKYYDEKSTTKHVLNAIQPKWLKIFISAEIESKGKSNYHTRNDVYSLVMQHACALTLSEGSGSSSSGGFSSRDMDESQRPSRNLRKDCDNLG